MLDEEEFAFSVQKSVPEIEPDEECPKKIPMDTLMFDKKFRKDRYICNPNKNASCNKCGCFWNGGLPIFNPCFCTSYFEYAVQTYDEMDELLKKYHDRVTEIAKEVYSGTKNS